MNLIFFRVEQPTSIESKNEINTSKTNTIAPPPYGSNQIHPVPSLPPTHIRPVPPPQITSIRGTKADYPTGNAPYPGENLPYPVDSQHEIPVAGKF